MRDKDLTNCSQYANIMMSYMDASEGVWIACHREESLIGTGTAIW
jgi:hypothetical protein